jgi:hypothetical protein
MFCNDKRSVFSKIRILKPNEYTEEIATLQISGLLFRGPTKDGGIGREQLGLAIFS